MRGRRLQPACNCVDGSSFVRLDERPDVVQILENDPLRPYKVPPSQRSVQVMVARAEPRTKLDVATLDDQGPREHSLFV